MLKDFERIVKTIAREVKKVSPNLENAAINFGPRNKIQGASGFRHQIDVSIEIPGKRLVLIECKRYKSKVTLSDMLVLIARIDDVSRKKRIHVSGNFFTTAGYTEPATKVGRYYRIDLNIVEDEKQFAVHIADNVLVKPEPLMTIDKLSGKFLGESG